MKKAQSVLSILLAALAAVTLAACSAQPSASIVETIVAKTVAAKPEPPAQEITQLVEVTRVVEVTAPAAAQGEATPTSTETPTTSPTVTPTAQATTPAAAQAGGKATATLTATAIQPGGALNWSLQYFVQRYNSMTDLQRKNLVATLPGKTVTWYAILDNVTADGQIVMKFPFAMYGSIILKGVSPEISVKIERGYQVEFSGMIESFDSEFSNKMVLTDVNVIAFYVEPTATPTGTATPRFAQPH